MLIFDMWRRTVARILMSLSKMEREACTDSMLKIQSIQASLEQIDGANVPDIDEIHRSLNSASQSFRAATEAQPSWE